MPRSLKRAKCAIVRWKIVAKIVLDSLLTKKKLAIQASFFVLVYYIFVNIV